MRNAQRKLFWNCSNQTFMECKITQYQADLALWEIFLNANPDIETIIELGAEAFGLSTYLALQALQRGMEFRTFDHKRNANLYMPLSLLLDLEGAFTLGNLFGEAGVILKAMLRDMPRPILLFCDNGDKPREFKEFVPCLQRGDFVGVHDWLTEIQPTDVSVFGNALKPWRWTEWKEAGSLTRFMKVVRNP